jgi:transposase
MIKVEEWFMIREFARQGLRITDMAPRVGGDRKPVRKSLADPEPPRYTARPPRVSTLDPCTSSVPHRRECGVYNGDVLDRELCARGDDGKNTMRRVEVQPRRRAARHHACGRFETPPGPPGQGDWGHCGTIWPEGRPRRLEGCALTLGSSRALDAECTVSSGMMACGRGHMHALA